MTSSSGVGSSRSETYESLDRRESGIWVWLGKEVDDVIRRSLVELGEASSEPATQAYRCQHSHRRAQDGVRKRLDEELKSWLKRAARSGDGVIVLELLRRRCNALYEDTAAWATVGVLSQAISALLDPGAEVYRQVCGEQDGLIREAMQAVLALLDSDVQVFRALNRGSIHDVITPLDGLLPNRSAGPQVERIQKALSELDKADLDGWRAELVRELSAEASVLRIVYEGILIAAQALEEHADDIRESYALTEDVWINQPSTAGLDSATDALQLRCAVLDATVEHERNELRPSARARTSALASRLRPWLTLLRSASTAISASVGPLQLTRAEVRYSFPFAVTTRLEAIPGLSAVLGRRYPGDRGVDMYPRESTDIAAFTEALAKELQTLGHEDRVEVEPIKLTEFWSGAGEGMIGGLRITLAPLVDTGGENGELAVWIELNRLENHCVCIERTLISPTPHDLYQALRVPGHYARDARYRYQWATTDARATDYGRTFGWRSVDEVAHDLILCVVRTLDLILGVARTLADPEPSHVMGNFHETVIVSTPRALGTTPEDIEDKIALRYGGDLLRTNVHRIASTLEEWLRLPTGGRRTTAIERAEFGYAEDWLTVLGDTTIFGVAGSASWQTGAYVEVAQFAASWAPQFVLWNRRLMRVLRKDREELPTGAELRDLEWDVRGSAAAVHGEELCRLPTHRWFLDTMLEAVGTTRMEQDLERRLTAIRTLIADDEVDTRSRLDNHRNVFLGFMAIFSLLNLSAFFAVIDLGDDDGLFSTSAIATAGDSGVSVITWEAIIQVVLFVAVSLAFVWMLSRNVLRRFMGRCRSAASRSRRVRTGSGTAPLLEP